MKRKWDGRLFTVKPDANTWAMMGLATCGTQVVFVVLGVVLWILNR